MAKGSKSSRNSNSFQREASVFTRRSLLGRSTYLSSLQDLRTWHPSPLSRPDKTLVSGRPFFKVGPVQNPIQGRAVNFVSPSVAFENPDMVVVCVRRRVRREVMHALKKTRKGAGAAKRRLAPWSRIKC